MRHNTSLVGRRKYLTHKRFLKKLTGETVTKFPAKTARCYKVSSHENGFREAHMMPAMVRLDALKTVLRPGRFSGRCTRECCLSVQASGWLQRVDMSLSRRADLSFEPMRGLPRDQVTGPEGRHRRCSTTGVGGCCRSGTEARMSQIILKQSCA